MPDNGMVERFHRTVLDEFYRVAFRKKIYPTIDELQTDLDAWMPTTTSNAPIRGVGASARRRCKPFSTRYHWQRKKNSWRHDHGRQSYRFSQPASSVRSSLS